MSPEQRMDNALSDLEGMVAKGASVEEALISCAREYDFPIDALRLRAEKSLGKLDSVRERSQRRAESLTHKRKVDSAIIRYLVEKPDAPFAIWFESETGHPPTKAQVKEVRRTRARSIANSLSSEFDDALDQ